MKMIAFLDDPVSKTLKKNPFLKKKQTSLISIFSTKTLQEEEQSEDNRLPFGKNAKLVTESTKTLEWEKGETPNTACPFAEPNTGNPIKLHEEPKEEDSFFLDYDLVEDVSEQEKPCHAVQKKGGAYFHKDLGGHVYQDYFSQAKTNCCPHNSILINTKVVTNLEGKLFLFSNQDCQVQIQTRSFLPFFEMIEIKQHLMVLSLQKKQKMIGRLLSNPCPKHRPVPSPSNSSFQAFSPLHESNEYRCSVSPSEEPAVSSWATKLGDLSSNSTGDFPDFKPVQLREKCKKCSQAAQMHLFRTSDLQAMQPCMQLCKKHEQPFRFVNFREFSWQKVLLSPFYTESLGFLLTFFIKLPPLMIGRKNSRTSSFVSSILTKNLFDKTRSQQQTPKKIQASIRRKASGFWNLPETRSFLRLNTESIEEIEECNNELIVRSAVFEKTRRPESLELEDILDALPSLFRNVWLKKEISSKNLVKLRNILSLLSIVFIVFPQEVMKAKNIDKYFDSFMSPMALLPRDPLVQDQLTDSIHYAFSVLGVATEFLTEAGRDEIEEGSLSPMTSLAMCDYFPTINQKELDAFCMKIANDDPALCQVFIANELIECFPFFVTIPQIISQCKKAQKSMAISLSVCDETPSAHFNCIQSALACKRLWQAVFHVTLMRAQFKGLKFLMALGNNSIEAKNFFLVSVVQKVLKAKNNQASISGLSKRMSQKEQAAYTRLVEFKEARSVLPAFDKSFSNRELPNIKRLVSELRKKSLKKDKEGEPFLTDENFSRREWRRNEQLFRAAYSLFRIQFIPLYEVSEKSVFSDAKTSLSKIFGSYSFLSQLESLAKKPIKLS